MSSVTDTDDDVIISGMLLEGAIVKEQKRKKQKLVKEVFGYGYEWIDRRTKHVAYHSLLRKISNSTQLTKHRIGIFSAYGRRIVQNSNNHRPSHGNIQ